MIGIALLGAGCMPRPSVPPEEDSSRFTTSSSQQPSPWPPIPAPPPVNAIDGLRMAYLAEAAGASLRLGQAAGLQTNCEASWHE